MQEYDDEVIHSLDIHEKYARLRGSNNLSNMSTMKLPKHLSWTD